MTDDRQVNVQIEVRPIGEYIHYYFTVVEDSEEPPVLVLTVRTLSVEHDPLLIEKLNTVIKEHFERSFGKPPGGWAQVNAPRPS